MCQEIGAEIAPAGGKLCFRQRLRPAHEIACSAASWAPLSEAVLHCLNLHVIPICPERAVNAAVMCSIAVPLRRSFPDAHRRQVRWLQRRDLPLVDRVIGYAVEADLAAAPRLLAGPGDACRKVLCLTRRKRIDVARRTSATAAVNAHAGVAVGHPFFGVAPFPVLIEVGRARRYIGMLAHHGRPSVGGAILKGEPL